MSATMSDMFVRPRLISGVCADLAARADTAVWLPRAGFLIFGVLHWFLAVVLYVVLARLLRTRYRRARPIRERASQAGRQVFETQQACYPDVGCVRDRFGVLDARLAGLEAATLREEAALARAFRDLEAGRAAASFRP